MEVGVWGSIVGNGILSFALLEDSGSSLTTEQRMLVSSREL